MLTASQVKYYLFFFPIIISTLFTFRHKVVLELLFTLLFISFFGSLVHAYFNTNVESFQFVTIFHISSIQLMLPIIIAVLVMKLNEGNPCRAAHILLGAIFFQLLTGMCNSIILFPYRESSYSTLFLQKAEILIVGNYRVGVAVHNPQIFPSFNADPRMCYACNFLKKIGSGYWTNQISIPEDMSKLEFPERRTAIELSPFYRFNEQYKKETADYSFEKAQTAFINKYEVDFIVIEKGARHPAWLPNCTDTLLTDPVSGTILATLRRPCHVNPT